MKKILLSTLAVVPVYLLGAFANASFDIAVWSDGARTFVSFCMAGAAFAAFGALSAI